MTDGHEDEQADDIYSDSAKKKHRQCHRGITPQDMHLVPQHNQECNT